MVGEVRMRRLTWTVSVVAYLTCLSLATFGSAQNGLKVFISVDMEGITGVSGREDVGTSGSQYQYFRKVMTREANAAIEGALAAGATEVVVRDSHGSKTNLLPEELNRNALLVRGLDPGPKNMMLPIDESFDAAIFIGYHAKAGTPDAILEHTSNGNVLDFSINGVSLPEGGYNALIAGLYNVPVVFVAGDEAVCQQIKGLVGDIETVAVKEAIGPVAVNLHPEVARERIRAGVEKAVRNREQYKPFKLSPPYTMKLQLKREETINDGALYPGATRTGDWEITYTSDDLLAMLKAFNATK